MQERYQTLARQILDEIRSGAYEAGAALPRRSELAEQYEVARATVDRAIQLLRERGILESRRGAGTYLRADVDLENTPRYAIALLGYRTDLPLPEVPGCQVVVLPTHTFNTRTERQALRQYDGLVWYLPSSEQLEWMNEFDAEIPQLVINRHGADYNYVSTDHAGAYYDITRERLATLPQATPIVLSGSNTLAHLVESMREDGFVKACREAQRFYELINLPGSFEEKLACLRERLARYADQPLLLVSTSLAHSGALMAWAREQTRIWGEDLLYSDFDNEYPLDIWGMRVTTFLQDFPQLLTLGLSKMSDLLSGRATAVQSLVPPRRVHGDT